MKTKMRQPAGDAPQSAPGQCRASSRSRGTWAGAIQGGDVEGGAGGKELLRSSPGAESVAEGDTGERNLVLEPVAVGNVPIQAQSQIEPRAHPRAQTRAWAVAVVDRSNLRIYRVERAGRWPRLALMAAQIFPDARQPDRAVYSGEPGAFSPPGPSGFHRRQGSMPERHLELEAGRRAARALGRKLNEWMGELRPGRWCLALSGELEAGVLKELDPGVRNRLLEVVPRNLVRVRQPELLGHFPRLGLWMAQTARKNRVV